MIAKLDYTPSAGEKSNTASPITTEGLLVALADTPRYKVRSAHDALQPQPPIEWIVENLFSAGSLSLVVGEAGSKKTWSLIDLAVCVARGETWLRFPTLPGPVLIIDEESGQRRLDRRLGQALRGHGADESTPLYYVSLASFDFGSLDDVNHLHSLITQLGTRFVVIDALADIMPGRDENAVKDVHPVFMALRRVVDATQAAIVVIHHNSKEGRYRGSSSMKGAVDSLIQVESKPESPNIDFKTEKARDTEPLSFAAVAHFELDQFHLSESPGGSTVKLGKAQEYVIRHLATRGDSEVDVIMLCADTCTSNAARLAVYGLADPSMGIVARIDAGSVDGGRGAKATYGLTEKGREYAKKYT